MGVGDTRSVDVRTRDRRVEPVDPDEFWAGTWAAADLDRAAADAELLGLAPLTIAVDGSAWTLQADGSAVPGAQAALRVDLDAAAFAELIAEERTALGLGIAGRVEADPVASELFCSWDPVLRSVLDDRPLHRPGDVDLRGRDLTRRFRLGEDDDEAAEFLADTGFLVLRGIFTDDEIDGLDRDLAAAVADVRPDDGASWWAATDTGERYPCRILDLLARSPLLQELVADPRFLAVGSILDDGHAPGDPFGEHFSDLTAEGLVKRVGSVEGLACLPWHKDCERGGHSMFCSGLTIGICLTPVDADHGGLDVLAGSHRTHVARRQVDAGVDLPVGVLEADRGDLTVHLSCAQHRSTHPQRSERRVVYTGFALPPRPGDRARDVSDVDLLAERAAIAGQQA